MQPNLHTVALLAASTALVSADLACSHPSVPNATWQSGSTLMSMAHTAYSDLKGDATAAAGIICQSMFPDTTNTTQCLAKAANATGLVGKRVDFPVMCTAPSAIASNITMQKDAPITGTPFNYTRYAPYKYYRKNLGLPSTCLDTEDKSGLLCYPKCPSDGHQWAGRGPVCWSKTMYFPYFAALGRGAGHPLRCPSDQEYSVVGAGCFYPCAQGYKGTGSECRHT
ncbi:g655 [Coccomyxa elongata]